MFKYGSFRLFLIKLCFGAFLILFSGVFLISLYSYSDKDPGFQKYLDKPSELEINNYFGLFGSYLSSYSVIMIGSLSFLIGLFLLIEGIKLITGIQSKLIFFKFIINFIGIIFINIFILAFKVNFLEPGLLSIFFNTLIINFLLSYISSDIVITSINFITLLIGIVLVLISFSIKVKYLNNILSFFKILKYLKYLNVFKYFYKAYVRNSSSRITRKDRSEPTIFKREIFTIKQKENLKIKNQKILGKEKFKFNLPSQNLLSKQNNKSGTNRELDKVNTQSALKLEKTLSEYGVEGKVVGFKSGPIVTLFEFVPNAGIKSSKIISLSEDIARAMSSYSARISSQPGKTSLGIEIPNSKRESVFFGDLIDEDRFSDISDSLRLALGKDISGEKVYADLEKMPHLLIAGTTGSGKSVGINTMILSLLYKFKPNECKLILIDPKMLELSIYEDIPHLLTPVVTDPKKAVYALKWVVREMENRYRLMSSVNVKNIESYNNKVLKTISSGRKLYREVQTGIDPDTRMPILEKKEISLEKMPFIVVVIDEMADLMMVAGKEVESLVQRLAQMARASGIHLITATQRPSVDVITGTIKANFPSRISYKVASKFDSRTILNEMGAEQLLGSGDMLLLENGGNIRRLHGGFVSEAEVEKVVDSIKNQATFDYKKEITLSDIDNVNRSENDLISKNHDELYNKAVEIVVKQQKVSTSFIQRYLQIGYNRAARIVEKMEEDRIISEANNAGKRSVLKKQ